MPNDLSNELMEAAIDAEVDRRLQERIRDPDVVIAAYQRKLNDTQHALIELQEETEEQRGFLEEILGSEDWVDMNKVAKTLARSGFGRTNMFRFLRDAGVLRTNNEPYQRHVELGRFRVVERPWTDRNGKTHITPKTVVSQKGLAYIRRLLNEGAAS